MSFLELPRNDKVQFPVSGSKSMGYGTWAPEMCRWIQQKTQIYPIGQFMPMPRLVITCANA